MEGEELHYKWKAGEWYSGRQILGSISRQRERSALSEQDEDWDGLSWIGNLVKVRDPEHSGFMDCGNKSLNCVFQERRGGEDADTVSKDNLFED